MVTTSLLLLRYSLLILSAAGCVLAVRGLMVSAADLRILQRERQNGPKRLSTLLRLKLEAFLLAVFVAMTLIGAVFMLSPVQFSSAEPLAGPALVSRIGWSVVAGLLVCMQIVSRKGRADLDDYYDLLAAAAELHGHRRATDPPNGPADAA